MHGTDIKSPISGKNADAHRSARKPETKRNDVAEQIRQRTIRGRKLERFIETVSGLPELYTEFDKAQWAALVDTMTIYSKDRIVFKLTCGMEIEM